MALLAAPDAAHAGAWTLKSGKVQVISGTVASRAVRRFDGTGSASEKILFNKYFAQNWMEYGLTDSVTLFAAPEYVFAQFAADGSGPTKVQTASVEAGGRILLLSRIGRLSIQTSWKTAGAFDMSYSASGEYGRQIELRLLYGATFKLFRRDGFLDVEVAERWIKRPRPNEMTVDATAGYWLNRKYLLMLQSFNTIAGGGAKPPYRFYRQHKVQFSVVQKLTKHWSLQTGAFLSPAGQNIVQESGLVAALWYRT